MSKSIITHIQLNICTLKTKIKCIHYVFSIIIAIGIASCAKEVDIDQPAYNKQVVVDGWIETGSPAYIFLTSSTPYLTNYDSASIRSTFINYAKITIYTSEGDSEILTLFKEDGFFPPFVYKTTSIKGKTGVQYDLKVEVKGKVITSSTTIPEAPQLGAITMEQQTDSSGYLNVTVQPNDTKTTYLFTQVKSQKCKENYHASFTPCYKSTPSNASFLLPIWRTRATNLYLMNNKTYPYTGWPKYQYSLTDTVYIKIGTLDVTSYNVLKSIYTDQLNKDNPFAFNNNSLITNINGGIGRWTGIGISNKLVWVQKN